MVVWITLQQPDDREKAAVGVSIDLTFAINAYQCYRLSA